MIFKLPELTNFVERGSRKKVITTVYLRHDQDHRLRRLRLDHRCNTSEFIRIAIDKLLDEWDRQQPVPFEDPDE
jgi:hypothetical protein